MKLRAGAVAVLLALGVPGSALAVKPGGSLYVKAKNTRVLKSPSPTADAVAILQPGQQVTWKGADPTQKQWHRVEAPGGKAGYVFQTSLSTTPPSMEVVAKDGKTRNLDPAAFVASGAAVKALGEGATSYGKQKGPDYGKAVDQIKQLETVALAVTPADISRHVAEAGLFPVLGPSESAVAKAAAPSADKKPRTTKKGGP
jgi:hypothetical protein